MNLFETRMVAKMWDQGLGLRKVEVFWVIAALGLLSSCTAGLGDSLLQSNIQAEISKENSAFMSNLCFSKVISVTAWYESQARPCSFVCFLFCPKLKQVAELLAAQICDWSIQTHIALLECHRPHYKHKGKSHVSKYIQLTSTGSDESVMQLHVKKQCQDNFIELCKQ